MGAGFERLKVVDSEKDGTRKGVPVPISHIEG